MPIIHRLPAVLAGITLAVIWFGPLPALAGHSFASHMTMHMAVVAVAAPLIALTVSGTRLDPVRRLPHALAPVPISLMELVVVWGWHVPGLHQAAREQSVPFVLEQASFLAAGTLLWASACGGDREQRRIRAGGGIAAMLFTSMHVTLLGALFALAGRPLFVHTGSPDRLTELADQHLGGVIMLLVGGASYLAGGLWLTAVALRSRVPVVRPAEDRSA